MVVDKFERYRTEHEQRVVDIAYSWIGAFERDGRVSQLDAAIQLLKIEKDFFGEKYRLVPTIDELISQIEAIKLSTGVI